ncbi:Scr1 family TA system antitoxin-like transcriptional regulator [Streptomyces sp. NPDC057718]|uniref:Scr1 family TA system antitoxin-like transcriptional regulator n=1 Tax=Streptomyces sp. NPDC057718 TaxID=3346225 RepID=UPI00367F604F
MRKPGPTGGRTPRCSRSPGLRRSHARGLGAAASRRGTTDAVERGVQALLERKTLLESDREVHIIPTENTLRTIIGSPEVMRARRLPRASSAWSRPADGAVTHICV